MRQLVDKSLEDYATAHSSAPSSNLRDLEERTHADCTDPQMLVGALEGALLRFIVGISAARRILEIGTFTGYSALTMAEVLPEDGEIITCDPDPALAAVSTVLKGRLNDTDHNIDVFPDAIIVRCGERISCQAHCRE